MRKVFAFIAFWLSCMAATFAQQYPVQVTPQLIPPYTLQVSEYYSPVTAGAEKLRVMLLNRDLQRPQLEVRLRMVIESQSLRIRTREDVVFTPVTLVSGTPYYLTPSELAQYFNVSNLEFSGISAQQYEQTGKLPEGFYTFCFDAVEVQTNQSLSSGGCAFAWLTLNEPPFLNMPSRAETITPRNPQNIVFNWTPRHTASPTAAFNTDYIFSIIELVDEGLAPEAAFTTGLPLFTDSTTATTYLYDVSKPQLIPGKKYAWRVQAKGKSGTEDLGMFRNQGYSETWWFTYKNDCNAPLGISATPQGQNVVIQWQAAMQHLDYKVEYREKNNADAEWFNLTNTQPRVMLTDLKPNKQYEYRVGGACEVNVFNYSDLLSFTTNAETVNNLANCGDSSQIPGSVPPNLLQTLNPGDTILAGDFKAVVAVVSGSGSFTGEGFVKIPWLFNIKVGVRFNGITVNTDKELVSGVIETTYDPTESGIADIDELLDAYISGYQIGNVVTGLNTTDHSVVFVIPMPGGITASFGPGYDSLTGLGPVTLIITPPGGGPADTIHTDHLPVTIQDAGGNIYQVNPNGSVTSIGTGGGDQMVKSTNTKHIDTDKAIVSFVPYPEKQVYAFDEWRSEYKKSSTFNKEYERLNDDYYVSAKAIAPGKTDYVKAVVIIKDTTIKADSIRFVNGKGTIYQRTKLDANVYEISIVGGPERDAQDMYALYPIAGSKTLNLGKLLLASYPRKVVDVKIVSQQGLTVPLTSIKAVLDSVYAPLNIQINLIADDPLPNNTWDLDGDGKLKVNNSGILSAYTEEMKKVIALLKSSRSVLDGTVYLFYLNEANVANVLGDMPIGHQYGFIFHNAEQGKKGRTAAHEIAHGVFKLKHVFEYGFSIDDLPDNLMNYSEGRKLSKYQWDVMHDPSVLTGLFSSDEQGQAISVGIQALSQFKKTFPIAHYTFRAPSGKPISIPADDEELIVTFSTCDDRVRTNTGEVSGFVPIGTLFQFTYKGRPYKYRGTSDVDYKKSYEEGTFNYFFGDDKGIYYDPIAKLLPQGNYNNNAIVALPFWNKKDQKVQLSAFVVDLPYDFTNADKNKYTAAGSFGAYDEFIGYGRFSLTPKSLVISGFANGVTLDYSMRLSDRAKDFCQSLSDWSEKGKYAAPLVIAHAQKITEYPESDICMLKNESEYFLEQLYKGSSSPLSIENANDALTAAEFFINYKRLNSHFVWYYPVTSEDINIIKDAIQNKTGSELAAILEHKTVCQLSQLSGNELIAAMVNIIPAIHTPTSEGRKVLVNIINAGINTGQAERILNKLKENKNALMAEIFFTFRDKSYEDFGEFNSLIFQAFRVYNPPIDVASVSRDVKMTLRNGFMYSGQGQAKDIRHSMQIAQGLNSTGEIMLGRYYQTEGHNDYGPRYSYYDYFEEIVLDFTDSEAIHITDDLVGEKIVVPAFFGLYLVDLSHKQENARFVRKCIDGGILVLGLATGGAGSVLGIVDLVVIGTDLVIQNNYNYVANSLGDNFMQTWDELSHLYGTVRMTQLGIELAEPVLKAGRSVISTIKINLATFFSEFKNLPGTERAAARKAVNAGYRAILRFGTVSKRIAYEIGMRMHLYLRVEGEQLIKSFIAQPGKNVTLEIANTTEIMIKEASGNMIKVGELAVDAESGFIRNLEIYPGGEYEIVGKINSFRYDFKGVRKQIDEFVILKVGGKYVFKDPEHMFEHICSSGAVISNDTKFGTFLVGSYGDDLRIIIHDELGYPILTDKTFSNYTFPVPSGERFNILNASDDVYDYWVAHGGFFTMVNAKWVDAAVLQKADIIVVSDVSKYLYNEARELTGFGKEIHRLEWKHNYRFDPKTKRMLPPDKAAGLPTLTKIGDNSL